MSVSPANATVGTVIGNRCDFGKRRLIVPIVRRSGRARVKYCLIPFRHLVNHIIRINNFLTHICVFNRQYKYYLQIIISLKESFYCIIKFRLAITFVVAGFKSALI